VHVTLRSQLLQVIPERDRAYDAFVPEFDSRTPSITRIYDYLLGGDDNFTVDRKVGDQLIEIFPDISVAARENRQFLADAVSWAASQGVTQFVDLGCGIPTSPSTHEAAHKVNPAARVVYVDNDLIALSHLRLLVAQGLRGVSVLGGDINDPGAVLLAASRTLVRKAPTCLIMGALLHFYELEEARLLVGRYRAPLAPGSYLVISVAHANGEEGEHWFRTYSTVGPVPLYSYSAEEVTELLDGTDLVPPGVVDARQWLPGQTELPQVSARIGETIVGVGRTR
jgi:hypothetical protein